jgi:hypothetical protein
LPENASETRPKLRARSKLEGREAKHRYLCRWWRSCVHQAAVAVVVVGIGVTKAIGPGGAAGRETMLYSKQNVRPCASREIEKRESTERGEREKRKRKRE